MGSIFSAIGSGINAIISAIANVVMTVVGAITTVRDDTIYCGHAGQHADSLPPIQVIVTIFDVIVDILCCRCFGSRRSSSRYRRRRGVY
ncbi:hypothetical protein F5J12DRAFT_375479 [Pisolithus orientalis]|uniref:uncharacterized protein n=1 Tax=Pisolithus orientalis TaxID=936130 RepID=UPI0022252A94|nr:uncharacterized protein F5J12DRAFT_375479 [Pisolithus orientalis]KAI6028349.1 hypothetical protein F5J12DRAFT_375479 [Pisolithus orientalis]